MKKKIIIGIILGIVAGAIDVAPMIVQELPLAANISAFSMWVIVGFLISTSTLKINPFIKGILISFLCLVPSAIIIFWEEKLITLLPIGLMTLVLGGLLGFAIELLSKEKNKAE